MMHALCEQQLLCVQSLNHIMTVSHTPSEGILDQSSANLGKRTSKSLFDIHHLPRARLHEAAITRSRVLQPPLARHHPLNVQIALVARNQLHGLDGTGILPVLALHVDHGEEIVEGVKRRGGGDVVNEEEGIGAEVGGRPEAAVFFLAGGVGEGEVVRMAIDDARNGIRVLCSRP